MMIATETRKQAAVSMTFRDKRGEEVTVSKHESGLIACTCRSWRIAHASVRPDLDYRCAHIYRAERQGLK